MLDTTTRKRIDDCRDILVGKLPDPKAQIEQITIALIYKFMDDMDKEAIDLGGTAKFFSGSFEKYSWDNLFDTKVTANEMLSLYSDAIASMDKNPNIPQLFRDIFKNAFLPYRDPETLKLFLKTIGEFEYTHSEKLGDAFEYLLSVMGSQGDAGQFRTPRHIIDFLVAVVDPSKTDTILDPACGTAGFLISAFKHIKEKNNHELTPDERKRLIQNFVGYDISPDMVRLSLVNLYLHGFSDPHIWEYDTLSSEDRWNETFDVILANPPFMSPKGGIRPHKKFSISSNRSEVLFVDYIAEHLNPKGKAGIIVPEGVIFQSGTAYKDLRKMLVENYLYAVVSLPAGVFNPYSGVKTSILLMDKEFAKANEEIIFVKIDNDGYGLGAQRNAVKGSQLEDAIEVVKQFKEGSFTESVLAHAVPKAEIAKNGDYTLSGEKYKIVDSLQNSNFELVELSDIIKLSSGNGLTSDKMQEGKYPVYGGNGIAGWHNEYFIESPTIVIGRVGAYCGSIHITQPNSWVTDNGLYVTEYLRKDVNQTFLALMLKVLNLNRFAKVGGQPSISQTTVKEQKIPLPPLSVQEEIVAEIEGYQKIIDGAKMVVENYKPKIEIDADWEMVELGKIADITSSKRIFQEEYVSEGIPFYRTKEIVELSKGLDISLELFISRERYNEIKEKFDVPKKGEILLSAVGTIGVSWVISDDREFYFKDGNLIWIKNINNALPEYIKMALDHTFINELSRMTFGAAYSALTIIKLKEMKISLPPIEIQQVIVTKIQNEQSLISANKQLIEIFEQKIKDRIAKVWGVEKTVKLHEQELSLAAEPIVEYKTN